MNCIKGMQPVPRYVYHSSCPDKHNRYCRTGFWIFHISVRHATSPHCSGSVVTYTEQDWLPIAQLLFVETTIAFQN